MITVGPPGGLLPACPNRRDVPARDNEAMTSGLIRCGHCGQANRVPAAASGTPRCGKCHQPLPWIADADDATFDEIAEAARIPVVVDLWAPWWALPYGQSRA
jgi:hypothetical protein